MSAASRSYVRRLLSAFFFALALAFLLLAYQRVEAQVLIPDPCKNLEPGSFLWYFHLCWLDELVTVLAPFVVPSGFLIR